MPPKSLSTAAAKIVKILADLPDQCPAPTARPRARAAFLGGGWTCRCRECPAAEKQRPNRASRETCFGCGRPQNKALSPPAALRLPPREPTTRKAQAVDGKAKGKDRSDNASPKGSGEPAAGGSAGRGADPAPDPAAPGPVGEAFGHHVPVKLPAAVFAAGDNEMTRLGLTPLRSIDPATLYRLPQSELPPFSMEDELAKVAPAGLTVAIAAKERELAAMKQASVQLPDDLPLKATILKEITDHEAVIVKMKKKAPGDPLMVEQLRTARQEHVEKAALQRQNENNGMQKAEARKAEQHRIIDKMLADLQALKSGINAQYLVAAGAWTEHHAKREAQRRAILTEFDARIAAIELRPAQPVLPSPALPAPPGAGLNPAPDVTPQDPLLKALDDVRIAQQALAAAQAAQEAAARLADHLAMFPIDNDDFPTEVAAPSEDQWQQVHNLWAGLEAMNRQEMLHAVQAPVTYGQLQAGVAIPRLILGEKLWHKAYPLTQPDDNTVVTVQLRRLMGMSLEAHRDKLVKDQERQNLAQNTTSDAVMAAVADFRNKKRKADDAAVPGRG